MTLFAPYVDAEEIEEILAADIADVDRRGAAAQNIAPRTADLAPAAPAALVPPAGQAVGALATSAGVVAADGKDASAGPAEIVSPDAPAKNALDAADQETPPVAPTAQIPLPPQPSTKSVPELPAAAQAHAPPLLPPTPAPPQDAAAVPDLGEPGERNVFVAFKRGLKASGVTPAALAAKHAGSATGMLTAERLEIAAREVVVRRAC